MTVNAHPLRDWDYLTVSNIVPPPTVEEEHVSCALCGGPMPIDHRAGLYTAPANCWWVCDDCGTRQAPELMTLVRQLRACSNFTVTIGGARIDVDAMAWDCPVCGHEHDDRHGGWHIVDVAHGRPVCETCADTLPADLRGLASALDAHERQCDLWRSPATA